MDRRDAILGLQLPTTARVSVAAVRPIDVIVVESEMCLSREATARIKESLKAAWPDNQIIVLDKGLHLRIARGVDG